jgi:hypothetical protein
MISFPTTNPKHNNLKNTVSSDKIEYQPVLLNSKEHAVGYLSKILNARVYEAAIETELQHARNLSAVSSYFIVLLELGLDGTTILTSG